MKHLHRSTLLAAAVAAALTLTACGDEPDTAAPRTDATVAPTTAPSTTNAPYATDRMTADASTATTRTDANTTSASEAAQKVERAGERAADAAGDAALTAKVKAKLMAEPGIDSLQIDVDTKGNRVTLSGEVDNEQNHRKALDVARSVDGVAGVDDKLTVKR